MATFANFKNSYLDGRWNEQHDFFFLTVLREVYHVFKFQIFSEVLAMGNPAGKRGPF